MYVAHIRSKKPAATSRLPAMVPPRERKLGTPRIESSLVPTWATTTPTSTTPMLWRRLLKKVTGFVDRRPAFPLSEIKVQHTSRKAATIGGTRDVRFQPTGEDTHPVVKSVTQWYKKVLKNSSIRCTGADSRLDGISSGLPVIRE